MENFITCKYISLVMLFEKVKMSVEVEMFTLIIFHKIKENIRSDNKEWIQAHTKLIRLCMRLFLILPVGKKAILFQLTVWNFFCKFRSSMIIDAAWQRFLLLSRCLFNSKNKLVCQERPENLGVYLLLIFQLLLLYQHPVRVHDFQLATNFSPVPDWHCPLFCDLESSQI